MELEIPSVPALPDARIRDQVDALAPVDIDSITSHVTELRRWDKAAPSWRDKSHQPNPAHAIVNW